MPLVDPASGEPYGTAPISGEADIDNAYRAAATAFCDWKRSTPSDRQKALLGFADDVEKAAEQLVAAEGRNTGNPDHVTLAEEIPPMVSITGSVAAGRAVAVSAGGHLKRTHLELGGKAPVIVFDAADLTDALAEQAKGATTTYGRPAGDEDAWVPPVNNATRLDRVLGFLSDVPDHATVAVGGGRRGDTGFYVEPTVIGGLAQDDALVQNEIFGPVITVQAFDSEDQALAWANGVEYGLASSVWTKDVSRAIRMSNALDFGCVWINTHIPLVAEMPHGGFKSSGHGKDLSLYGFEDYTRIKHVMVYTG